MASSSSMQRMNGPLRILALALLLISTVSHDLVAAQEDGEEEVIHPRGDMIVTDAPEPETATKFTPGGQMNVIGSIESLDNVESLGGIDNAETNLTVILGDLGFGDGNVDIQTMVFTDQPPRGDGPADTPAPPVVIVNTHDMNIPEQGDVHCVAKEKVQDKDAVSLTLREASTCEETRLKIASILEDLCGQDCKLQVYQEDNSNQLLLVGVGEDDESTSFINGMAEKFTIDNIRDKVDVTDAHPRWGNKSRMVLVALLLAGLILAALLVAGYYLKTHRSKTAKGVRLAESFQVDEENQANTLVSVAPLHPQEPLDKPTVNGDSAPADDGKPEPPPTNGHSATQTPVADTEM